MSQPLVVGLFKEMEDAQTALNEYVASGFDADNVSLITKNATQGEEPEENNEDYESELDGGMQEVRGLIEPISSGEFGNVEVTIPNIGDMIFAGPIASIVEEEDLETKVVNENLPELEFTKILKTLGFDLEDSTYIENYMKNNCVLLAFPIDENKEEINTILSDAGAELIEEVKAEWG